MSRFETLFEETGQSPWLNGLTRTCLRSGQLAQLVEAGIRGVLAPEATILDGIAQVSGPGVEGPRLTSLAAAGLGPEEICWELAIEDVSEALAILRPVWERCRGADGFVSVELPPALAGDTEGIVDSARALHQQIGQPNLLVAVPATTSGLGAIRQLAAEGWSTNATMIFSLDCYQRVIDAYLEGLETCPGDLSGVHSVASFCLDRIDSGVDPILEGIGSRAALGLRGQAGKAFAQAAYEVFVSRFDGMRWALLRERGANVQRPLSARVLPGPGLDACEVVGPDTICAMPEEAILAFEDGPVPQERIEPQDRSGAMALDSLRRVGIDLETMGTDLQQAALAEYTHSYRSAVDTVARRVDAISNRS